MPPDPFLPDPVRQGERSRRASERYLLLAAVAEQRSGAVRQSGPVRRLRHRLAGALVGAARLIDAADPAEFGTGRESPSAGQ